MKTHSLSAAVVVAALALTAFAGCYTKLMPFREAVALRKSAVATSGGTTTQGIDYRDNCTSCHSEAELNDRASEIDEADFYSIHGITYDPYGWQNPYVQPPWWNPTTTLIYEAGPGGVPVITTGGRQSGAAAEQKNPKRTRESGSTRGDERPRTPRAAETSTTASPTPSPSASAPPPPPASSTPAVTTTPAQTPPAQAPETRSRSNEGGETRTRKSGSGRE